MASTADAYHRAVKKFTVVSLTVVLTCFLVFNAGEKRQWTAWTVIPEDIPESETIYKISPSYKKVYGFIMVFLMAYGNN